ncbi:MAG: glutamate decarboxylase [Clostridia bacterium]|nr:glutamate decarboxylase [Clostridia bacterium]
MLYGEKNKDALEKARSIVIGYGIKKREAMIPKYKLRKLSMDADLAKALIEDQLLDEGNARQNLATFCQTKMEKQAVDLMAETLDKNAIDKSEYPQTAELENRCVNILADLWNVPKKCEYLGTSTVGSSEACMLAGMAMKFRWRNQAKELGMDVRSKDANLVISSAYQVCWEKFCTYWDVEMRIVPVNAEQLTLDLDHVMDYVDEYTIGIVGIQGSTYSGEYDDIKSLNALVTEYNKQHKNCPELVIHIDAACGGMFTPFAEPEMEWDFRLSNVVSISTSGHKYGLTYPGVGWIVWRDRKYLPEKLVFEVSYLGGEMPTMAINFSRSASQIVGQYYNFLRLGWEGYKLVHLRTQESAYHIGEKIEETGLFDIYNKGNRTPIVCYRLKEDAKYEDGTPVVWNMYDLSDRLRMYGWQVPTYPLPKGAEDVIIQRIVCRADLTFNLAESFVRDFREAIADLKEAHVLCNEKKSGTYGFTFG